MNAASKRRKKRRRAARTPTALIIAICALVLILIIMLVVFWLIPAVEKNRGAASDFFDSRALSGNLPGRTQEEIQAELDKIVEEGMFNISIASIVTVKEGDDEALARIENIAANHHNMKVSITLDGENEPIYESAGLAPGQYIEYAKLSRKLAAGEYHATALFTAYDTDDLSQVGQAAAKITIVVGP